MKTSLSKIVEYIKNSEEQIIIVSGEYSPQGILLAVSEDATGLRLASGSTIEEKIGQFVGKEEVVKNALEFPDGRSRFFCVYTGDAMLNCLADILVEIISCVMELDIRKIIIEPVWVMLRGCTEKYIETWINFKKGLEDFYSVEFITIEDDFSLRGRKYVG